jgi:hypothetical protein
MPELVTDNTINSHLEAFHADFPERDDEETRDRVMRVAREISRQTIGFDSMEVDNA